MEIPKVVGLIAGGKQFPILVANGVKSRGARLVVAGFSGHTNLDVEPLADVWRELKLGKLSKLIKFFKENDVECVTMAGTIDKPKIMDIRHLDMRAIKLVFRNKNKGDATILKALAEEFEREGIEVIPPHVILPELLTPEGVHTKRKPTDREWEDLAYGWKIAKELGRMDIGQCLVLREGIVSAVEALEGTDATISRGCQFGGKECVVMKVFKPGQEERTDLPSAGVDTIRIMAEGGATCLAVEAGRSLIFDFEETVKLADKSGISIVGLTEDILNSVPS